MKYFSFEEITYNDGTADKKQTITHTSKDAAVGRFFQAMTYMTVDKVESVLCVVFDENGYMVRSEKWNRKHGEEASEEVTV